MNDIVTRYNKPVMICEVGMSWTDSTACNSFISDLIAKTKSVNGNKGLGVFIGNLKNIITGRVIY
jgi:arabinogalactan endo-1,4-beta-galactosidase